MSHNLDFYEEIFYFSKQFPSNYDLAKKIIEDLATESDEYDIIIKKRKFSNSSSFLPLSRVKSSTSKIISKSIKNRHKNCPKLFGRAFFRLLLNEISFKNEFLIEENMKKLAKSGIDYPDTSNEIFQKISINGFFDWLKSNNYHRVYNNLQFYREVWKYQEIDKDLNQNWVTQHYKYFLTGLMKEFFEVYAFGYVIHSKIQLKNAKKYLKMIPIFLRGIENPETFTCLKFGSNTFKIKPFKRTSL